MLKGEDDFGAVRQRPQGESSEGSIDAEANIASVAESRTLGLYEMIMKPDRPHYSDFLAVSRSMMDGYAKFASLGMPRDSVALAMLGGTINLYQMFNLHAELPNLLRSIADFMESDTETH